MRVPHTDLEEIFMYIWYTTEIWWEWKTKRKERKGEWCVYAFPHFPPLPSDEYMYIATIAVHYAICERERGWKIYTYWCK